MCPGRRATLSRSLRSPFLASPPLYRLPVSVAGAGDPRYKGQRWSRQADRRNIPRSSVRYLSEPISIRLYVTYRSPVKVGKDRRHGQTETCSALAPSGASGRQRPARGQEPGASRVARPSGWRRHAQDGGPHQDGDRKDEGPREQGRRGARAGATHRHGEGRPSDPEEPAVRRPARPFDAARSIETGQVRRRSEDHAAVRQRTKTTKSAKPVRAAKVARPVKPATPVKTALAARPAALKPPAPRKAVPVAPAPPKKPTLTAVPARPVEAQAGSGSQPRTAARAGRR